MGPDKLESSSGTGTSGRALCREELDSAKVAGLGVTMDVEFGRRHRDGSQKKKIGGQKPTMLEVTGGCQSTSDDSSATGNVECGAVRGGTDSGSGGRGETRSLTPNCFDYVEVVLGSLDKTRIFTFQPSLPFLQSHQSVLQVSDGLLPSDFP